MKLLKLEVRHFGCVRAATVELGPGLNVLFGPNDLGKSTLARALRAALLLPHGSSAAAGFAPWDGGESPEVVVTFQTEAHRFHRVHKRFGDKGASFLEESKDGLTFHTEKKAREVDGRLRELLRWGIRAPGGQGAPKGLPESFLGTVLLGEQADVTSILRQTLAKDTDESGRARLTTALEAFAQDPLFKHILAQAQGKVDEAFSATGKRKRGRASPFTQVSEAVRLANEEVARLEHELRMTEQAEERLRALNAERDRLAEARDEARVVLARVGEAARLGAARRAVELDLERARAQLARSEQQRDAVAALRDELQRSEQAWVELAAALARLDERSAAAATRHDGAKEALRARKDDEAQRRQLARSQLETQRAQLTVQLSGLRASADTASRASRKGAELATARAELAQALEQRDGRVAERDALVARREKLADTRATLELAERVVRLEGLGQAIAELDDLAADVDEDRRRAASQRDEALALVASAPEGFPSRDALRAMEQVEQDLRVAEARLGGGLSVRVRVRAPLEVLEVLVDGASRAVPASGGTLELDAQRELSLRLGELADVHVTAGQPEARAAVERARARHAVEVRGPLDRCGVPTLEALRERLGELEARAAEADRRSREADALERRASERAERLAKLPDLRGERRALRDEVAADPRSAQARAALDDLGRAALPGKLAAVRRELAATPAAPAVEEALGALQARAATLEERARAAETELAALGPQPDGGWASEADRLRAELKAAEVGVADVERDLARLDNEQSSTERDAERALEEAERELAEAQRASASARETQAQRADERAGLRGRLEVVEPQLAALDLDADRLRVAELEARLAAEAAPRELVTDDDLRQAEAALAAAEHALRAHDADLQKAKGALETVGGDVVKERVEQAREAQRMAERSEREVDVEYGAWSLLLDKLREAESTEGRHLGEALGVPVTQQFAALTASRYGKLQLDPNLGAEGVLAAGQLREIAALSVGTQEQLATLLRLTIAEQLGSMLVLDDQLTQTDATRGAWFRTVLRDRAVDIQVIVLTCRPTAYIDPDELPAAAETVRDRAAGFVRAVDLEKLVQRSPSAPPPPADGPLDRASPD